MTHEELERSSAVIITKWKAYRAIQGGGTYSLGDKNLYTSVRKRLKAIWRGQAECEEKLSRFRYLEE